jgi:hypothetical protein
MELFRRGGSDFTQVGFWGQIVTFVGAGVVWSGEGTPCVVRRPRPAPVHAFPLSQGDASVPSPHTPTPAPTGTKSLLRQLGRLAGYWTVGGSRYGCANLATQ